MKKTHFRVDNDEKKILDRESKSEKYKPSKKSSLHFDWQDYHPNQSLIRLCFEIVLNPFDIWTKDDYNEYVTQQKAKINRNIERTEIIDEIKKHEIKFLTKELNTSYQLKKKKKQIEAKISEIKKQLKNILNRIQATDDESGRQLTETIVRTELNNDNKAHTKLEKEFLKHLLEELKINGEIDSIKKTISTFANIKAEDIKKDFQNQKMLHDEEKEKRIELVDKNVTYQVLKELGNFEDINPELDEILHLCYVLAIEPESGPKKMRKLSADQTDRLEAYLIKIANEKKHKRRKKLEQLKNVDEDSDK